MYNAEKYIENCLDSILNSDLPKGEYEVLIINDGSEDKGPEIAMRYANKHDNFTYLTQENQGQSVARNYGIKECKGEYVWFVDSDDVVCSDLQFIYNFLKKEDNIDIIKTKILTFEEGQAAKYTQLDGTYTLQSGRELLLNNFHPSSVCNMIVKKSILIENNLYFIPGITSQDTELSHRIYTFAKKIYTFNYITYLYLHNSNSTTQSKEVNKIIKRDLSNITISKSFRSFSSSIKNKDPELSEYFLKQSSNVILGILLNMIRKRKERKGTSINMTILNCMKEQNVYPIKLHFTSIKKKFFVRFINNESFLRMLI